MPAREGAKIFHDGEEVGTVTSGGFGPSLSAPIAMAYVHARSEEHTSELQSLMRTSYAVFCLKKTITQLQNTKQTVTQIQPPSKNANIEKITHHTNKTKHS